MDTDFALTAIHENFGGWLMEDVVASTVVSHFMSLVADGLTLLNFHANNGSASLNYLNAKSQQEKWLHNLGSHTIQLTTRSQLCVLPFYRQIP